MESPLNMRLGPRSSMPKPVGFSGDPLSLIGVYVKLSFVSRDDRIEHMWIKVKEVNVEARTMTGILNNDPILCLDLADGDLIKDRSLDEIEDIDI